MDISDFGESYAAALGLSYVKGNQPQNCLLSQWMWLIGINLIALMFIQYQLEVDSKGNFFNKILTTFP